ncbi:aldehyde dehydrogenase family protein, partial [Nocardioides sp. J54]|uniref:aldehyde dehydrogenase family protein n=1 Tax=Nocardioides sp. J54 TaxID=935866 RepID=UPI0004AD696F
MNNPQDVTQPQHWIDGEFVTGSGSDAIDVFDPATGKVVTQVTAATDAEVDAAVAAAAAAFDEWSQLSITRRVQYLHAMRHNVVSNGERLARTISLDQGKTLEEARGEVMRAAEFIDTAIAAPMLAHSRSGHVAGPIEARNVREPLGVCVAVTPFNFPVMNPSQFSAWALVTGNTLVVKPSEQDPVASTALFHLFAEAGLPNGVLNLVHGRAEVSKRLVDHPDVAAVSCITSTPTARAIHERASALGKRVQANGGAKNPILVAGDADLALAAEGIVTSAFGMAGQRCLAGTRIVVLDEVYDELVDRVAALTDALVVGAGLDEGTTMGPVVSAASRSRLEDLITQAVDAGATAVRDGRGVAPMTPSATSDGFFVGPTVLADLAPTHPAEFQETFGPVIAMHRVGDLDQAIALANDTEFGNASTIFTRSGTVARRFERASRAGNIGINTFPAPPANFVMGGLGTSFFGETHVCGDAPLRFYTEEKLVVARW